LLIYKWKPTNRSIIIQFISYVWWLLYVSALYCHPRGAFLVLWWHNTPIHILLTAPQLSTTLGRL
jgi:hypothetical protein